MAANDSLQTPAEIARKARQERAIVALAMGSTVTKAARVAGVNRWTLYDWMKRPDFRDELEKAARGHAESDGPGCR